MDLGTIRILFQHNDWGREQLMAVADRLTDEQLDRPFEMGPGTLRKTLEHIFAAEWVWLARWGGRSPTQGECPRNLPTMGDLLRVWRETATQREAFLNTLTDADLERDVDYRNTVGKPGRYQLGIMMLHVCTHGTHHRAQAINMLRQLGVTPPELDVTAMVPNRA
jgi:uncharacterized damage-inducible protein DinB